MSFSSKQWQDANLHEPLVEDRLSHKDLSDEDLTNEGLLEEYLLFEVKQKKQVYEAPLTENLFPEVIHSQKMHVWSIFIGRFITWSSTNRRSFAK